MSTKADTILKFHLFMDDTSELSSAEESDLYDKIYQEVCMELPWEFAKKSATGTLSTSVAYVSLPSDFGYVVQNHNFTEDDAEAQGPVVWVIRNGSYIPYKVISWSDRRQYLNRDGFCYIDIPNARLVFCYQPVAADSYEFDYCAVMPALASTESPVFPARFHPILYHRMCIDSFIIQQSDKAKSYAAENGARAGEYLQHMRFWNAELVQMT